jgi:hypothetical protein
MRRHSYEIRVLGALGSSWAECFGGLNVRHERNEVRGQTSTILSGSMDQAALHGILARIRDLGLPLIAVNRMDGSNS